MNCERNMAGPEEDCGSRIAYRPCGKTGTHLVEGRVLEWYACAEHASEAKSDGAAVSELVLIEVAT